jgi:hypothetical protein
MKSRFAEIREADLPERSEDFIVLCTISSRTYGMHFCTITTSKAPWICTLKREASMAFLYLMQKKHKLQKAARIC